MEDEDDAWAVTTSPSASPPPHPASAAAAGFISTALSLNSRLHLLASGGRGSPFHPGDGGFGGCGGYRNAAASPSSFFSPAAASFPHIPPLEADPARRALEREMCLGGATAAAAAWTGAGAGGGTDRRKKRMINNRESASRSRARKQAYVTQLKSEVQHLQQENEKLRVKYEQLRESVEVPVPVKRTRQRVLSAPF